MRALILLAFFALAPALAQDPRFCGPPARDSGGTIIRSAKVLAAFERQWPKPPPLPSGERWFRDHAIPLACGGCDSVENLQWLPETAWRAKSLWERKVYGGRGISPGCP